MTAARSLRRPRLRFGGSVRTRMTLLYGGVFTVISLGVLIAAQQFQQSVVVRKLANFANVGTEGGVCDRRPPAPPCPSDATGGGIVPTERRTELRESLLDSQRLTTVIAFAVIAVLAFAVCWWLTGRLLRPLNRITATAQRLSLSTLHERIAMTGPEDELKKLADTFDAMLDRLEHAIASQRRFVANASHELRTPIAIQRTAIEIGLSDPSPAKVARIRAELLRATQRSERLIEGLLVLAQGERGLDARAPVDLAVVVDQVVGEHMPLAEPREVDVAVAAHPVTVAGDEVLLTRLVANLVQNAIRHNHPGGHVLVELSPDTGLVVCNTGPHVPPDRVDELFEPFRRLHRDRTGSSDGAGLGLSIVAAIAKAHDGTVHATANPDGGLSVTVTLPTLIAVPAALHRHNPPAP
ncbi:HAMP domain-containing histidine kinase [Actinomadura graeca]|uniref:histidine kinase n=1 Tax=Actinomadura graeca TaxID=2750812 RepID=A0ABX8QRX3_9ACTN|nr:HAMP domain-containing sensor histidine kinase [Actinomadura graeca]QXJ21451.1 HAMP domain-containing histidine kinase [Actinomadura graeca]